MGMTNERRWASLLMQAAGWAIAVLWTVSATAALNCDNTTPIYKIQGKSHVSPFLGMEVKTCGVVTAIAFDGYYLQDPEGDVDDATSDGIFVFDRSQDKPIIGTLLRLSGIVTEFIPGGMETGNLSITQLSSPTILKSQADTPLPAPVIIGRGGRIPPNMEVISEAELPVNLQSLADTDATRFDPQNNGIDFYESLEGMLVTVEDPVAVSAIRQSGRFNAEVFVLANNGADIAPADARTARGGINLQPHPENRGDQNPERVQIQFNGTLFGSTDYPSIKVGDRLSDVTGVVGYSFGNFEVNVLHPADIIPSNITREKATPSPQRKLTIASYNVLNLSAVEADNEQRAQVARHIARNLRSPDIIALQEVQDNNGDASDCPGDNPAPCAGVLDATLTLQRLVEAIVAAGGPGYELVNVDPLEETTQTEDDGPDVFGGTPLGNIRNAFLYNPRRVQLLRFQGLTRDVLRNRGVSRPRAFDFSRDPLEAVFKFKGEDIAVINNHFTSRFGSTPIFGGPQPFVQAGDEAREAQSLAMHEVTLRLLRDNEDADVVILGDLNTFEFTDDLTKLLAGTGQARILRNLVVKNRDVNKYTFIFEGNSQVLDHIFVTDGLFEHARFDIVHVNVDFPRLSRDVVSSDHEPLRAILTLDKD